MPDRRGFLGAVAGLAAGAVLPTPFPFIEMISLRVDAEERTERMMAEVQAENWISNPLGRWSINKVPVAHCQRSCHFQLLAPYENVHGTWSVDLREFDHLSDKSAKEIMRRRMRQMLLDMSELVHANA